MPLEEYRAKRHFDRTPEPAGGAEPDAPLPRFVVQKHAASRLHYDFRLEMDGVLRSWAIPKGPSLDTSQKRLAVQVEDHPLEYGDFEGTIPAGEYGGGTVMVWDHGTWEPINDPVEGYARGDFKVRLSGEKLKGGFVLVRLKPRAGEKQVSWLLIKERDGYMRPLAEGDVLDLDRSVATGRTMDEIAAGAPAARVSGGGDDPAALSGAVAAPSPERIEPMLATAVETPPDGADWLHEIKLDGYRALCRVRGEDVRFFTRSGADWTARFSALVPAVRELALGDAWLDGEVVALLPDGRSGFGALQAELKRGDAADLTYFAFDLPYLRGFDLRAVALEDRKALLGTLVGTAAGRVRYLDHVWGGGAEFHRQTCAFALEGAVSKRAPAPYRSGRGRDWRKHKCRLRQEFVVVGYTLPASGGAGIGALVLAAKGPSGALAYSGRAGTGFSAKEAGLLRRRLDRLATDEPPVTDIPTKEATGVRWARPEVVVEVEFAEWTEGGLLRQASFVGVREDKPATEVHRERPVDSKLAVLGVNLTHPDKVLFHEVGVTKRELATYYERVAEHLLPELRNRPLVLVRCPHGTEQACFYQKEASVGFPEGMRTVPVQHEDGIVNYALADDIEDVIGLVQLGVLEIHTWGSLADDVERPDRIVIDLDPGPGVPWSAVSDAALLIRDGLVGIGLGAFAKTTGSKGLHIVTPITREGDWGAVKEVARTFCEAVALADPTRFTTNPRKAERVGRVFIDYVRNSRGATAVAAYSSRARPGATVSVPVRWDEIEAGVRSDAYTIRSVPRRVAALREDPWANYEDARRPLDTSVRNALGLM
ncbi:MAG: DNA ligase D [Actinobacteria bacterium HGW-Actinobacteria-1]|jgi:bifunctional non-homologous end joining protein LigD|nr:MAG: DNA ligase D [Actinobacteria bacterium HGW-Actinobacteria-1]